MSPFTAILTLSENCQKGTFSTPACNLIFLTKWLHFKRVWMTLFEFIWKCLKLRPAPSKCFKNPLLDFRNAFCLLFLWISSNTGRQTYKGIILLRFNLVKQQCVIIISFIVEMILKLKQQSYSLDRRSNFAINENSRSQKLLCPHCIV